MKFRILLLSIALIGTTSIAQTLDWVAGIGGTDIDVPVASALDSDGNVYTVGHYKGTCDFDPGAANFDMTATTTTTDVFLMKLNSSGEFQWAFSIGSTGNNNGTTITVDSDNNVIISGTFRQTADFDPSAADFSVASGSQGANFIAKYNSAGDFQWVATRSGASTGVDFTNGLITDDAGNVFATGSFSGTRDFDPGAGVTELTSLGWFDAYIWKLDENGIFQWAKGIGGSEADCLAEAIDLDNSGNIYIGGYFSDTVDFDPVETTADTVLIYTEGLSSFVAKYDNSGDLTWAKHYKAAAGAECFLNDLVVDDAGSVYTVGAWDGDVDFEPGSAAIEWGTINQNAFMSKLDTDGNYVWINQISSTSDVSATSILVDGDEQYVCGVFVNTAYFDDSGDSSRTSAGSYDTYITKRDINGDLLWVQARGNTGFDYTYDLDLAADGSLYNTGRYNETLDFDITSGTYELTAAGSIDGYIMKFEGCTVNNAVTQDGITLTADGAGLTYQWVDCDDAYAAISGETSQSFTASTDGNYAVVVSNGECSDTSACFAISGVGITENGNNELVLYPNPANSVIRISGVDIETITVIDLVGRELIFSEETEISIVDLPAGTYLARIKSKEALRNVRFIKE